MTFIYHKLLCHKKVLPSITCKVCLNKLSGLSKNNVGDGFPVPCYAIYRRCRHTFINMRSVFFGIKHPQFVSHGVRLGNIGQTADIVNADVVKHRQLRRVGDRNVDSTAFIPRIYRLADVKIVSYLLLGIAVASPKLFKP